MASIMTGDRAGVDIVARANSAADKHLDLPSLIELLDVVGCSWKDEQASGNKYKAPHDVASLLLGNVVTTFE